MTFNRRNQNAVEKSIDNAISESYRPSKKQLALLESSIKGDPEIKVDDVEKLMLRIENNLSKFQVSNLYDTICDGKYDEAMMTINNL